MGSLNTLGHNFFSISATYQVPPGCFRPQPKVDSLVITGQRRKEPQISIEEFRKFEAFVRLLFSQKRKQLGSVLKKKYSHLDETFEKLGISTKIRAECP